MAAGLYERLRNLLPNDINRDYSLNTFPRNREHQGRAGLETFLSAEEGRAFVLVDMQEKFLGEIEEQESIHMVLSQLKVLYYCSRFDLPVLVFEYEGDGTTIFPLNEAVTAVPRHRVLTKVDDDGFVNPEATSVLQEWNVAEIYLMGINASFCVQETAVGGLKNGFKIVTADRLIADPKHYRVNKDRKWFEKHGKYFLG